MAAGVGVTVLPGLGATQLPAGVVAIPLVAPTPVRHVYVAVKASVEHHPAARRAVALLRERVTAPARVECVSDESTPDIAPGSDSDFDPLADLLDTLDLEELGTARITVEGVGDRADFGESGATVFLGRSQKMPHGRVFGGQVLAQCVIAAGRTMQDVDDGDGPRHIHSLHGYFMRPGDDTKPIRFAVERMRDGNSFSTRRVHAIQDGAAHPVDDHLVPGGLGRPGPPGPDARRPRPGRAAARSPTSSAGSTTPGARHLREAPDRAPPRREQPLRGARARAQPPTRVSG